MVQNRFLRIILHRTFWIKEYPSKKYYESEIKGINAKTHPKNEFLGWEKNCYEKENTTS